MDVSTSHSVATPAIRTIAMPSDTNPSGDIFGGWLMAQMDLAAGNLAARVAKGRCATVAVDGMQFLRPVAVGDEVSIFARLASKGRSSMKIEIKAMRRRREAEVSEQVTEALFVFVAIKDDGTSRELPKD